MNGNPGIQHPGKHSVTIGAFLEFFLTSEGYVPEERMRQVVQTIVQTSMEEMQENRRNLLARTSPASSRASPTGARLARLSC